MLNLKQMGVIAAVFAVASAFATREAKSVTYAGLTKINPASQACVATTCKLTGTVACATQSYSDAACLHKTASFQP